MSGRHRRSDAQALMAIPAQCAPRPVGVTDALTEVEHVVTDEELACHRHVGRYLAVCGKQVLAASMTATGRSQCRPCRAAVVPR